MTQDASSLVFKALDLLLAAVLSAPAVGCGSSDAPVDGGASRSPRGDDEQPTTLTILFESDDYVLGPSRDDTPKFLMFEPLVRGYYGRARPGLAERWEHSADFRTWTYHLRRDVRWHDGVPLTAYDLAFSLELFQHPEIALVGRGLDSIAVPDAHTLVVSFLQPRRWPSGWQVFYPKHLLEDLDPTEFFDWEFWTRPVGNGPYRYVRGVPNTMIELEANADYFEGAPPIERVVLRLSSANKVLELLSGNVDAVYYLSSSDIGKLAADPRFRLYFQWVTSEPQAIHWNQRHPFLADAVARRALSRAIDRRELARMLYLPDEMPLVGGLSPDDRALDLYREGKLDQGVDYDPDAAGRLLDEAGWLDRDGDGVREREGIEARFTLLARQGGILSTLVPAVLLQAQLGNVGVDVEIRPHAPAVWHQLYRSGDFDATVHDVPNDPALLLRDDFFGGGTRIGYRSPEIVALLQALTLEVDEAVQDSLYAQINEILRRDVPVTFLFPYFEAYAAHRKVRGLRTPDRPEPIGAIRELWIEDAGREP